MRKNMFVAGGPFQTPPESLQCSPRLPSWISGEGKVWGREVEGRRGREERAGVVGLGKRLLSGARRMDAPDAGVCVYWSACISAWKQLMPSGCHNVLSNLCIVISCSTPFAINFTFACLCRPLLSHVGGMFLVLFVCSLHVIMLLLDHRLAIISHIFDINGAMQIFFCVMFLQYLWCAHESWSI